MRLAFGVIFLWMGGALLYMASHGLQSPTPWGAFQTVIGKMRDG